jgi:hypothetical protein
MEQQIVTDCSGQAIKSRVIGPQNALQTQIILQVTAAM